MATLRRQRFVNAQVAWMLASILGLEVVGALTLELFLLVSLIGFMLLTLATEPATLTPGWRSRLRWPILIGFLVFAYLLVREILAMIPPGL